MEDPTGTVTEPSGALAPVVKRLGAASFFNDLAGQMVYPLLPAFITTRLGGGALALGAMDGIAEAAAASAKLAAGWLTDRTTWTRSLVTSGYLVSALVRPAIAWASAAGHVIALRAADRIGKGIRNPQRDTVIADASHQSLRGRALGLQRAAVHAGAVVGPLVAWVMLAPGDLTPPPRRGV